MSMSVLTMLCLLASAQAAGLKSKAQSSSSSLQTAVEQDVKLFGTKLRGNVLSNWANDAQELRNEDDDDDDEDDAKDAQEATYFAAKLARSSFGAKYNKPEEKTKEEAEAVAFHAAEPKAPEGLKTEPKAMAAAPVKLTKTNAKAAANATAEEEEEEEEDEKDETEEEKAADKAEDERDDKEEETRGALEAAQEKKAAAHSKVEAFEDDKAFDVKIAHDVKLIANETQSPALSNFMGELRQEMRAYAKPSYPAYLEARADAAEKRVKELEGELAKDGKEVAKKSEKGEEPAKLEHEGESAKEVSQQAGETWAIGFFANIALLAVVFAMASQKKDMQLKNYTWFVIDQVIAIFLAVMYFQAFDSLLDFAEGTLGHPVLVSILHAFIMLAMIVCLAGALRKNDLALAILCGAGAHAVSFSSIHAAAGLQVYFMSMAYGYTTCILGMVILGLGLAVIGYLVYTAKKKARLLDQEVFMDNTDDLENDFGAMAFSVVFTMFMRFILTGHHPEDDETEFDHTAADRTHMFLYGCVCLIVAGLVAKFTAKKAAETNNYAVKRVLTFFRTVACMNVAWAFLYWGEWEFFGVLYPGEAIKGRVMFAIVATFVCGLGMLALTKLPGQGPLEKKSKLVALTALSLVCGWSWELCFDAAVEDMTEGVAHPVGWKIGTTCILFAIVVPVYAFCVKPISGPCAEAIE